MGHRLLAPYRFDDDASIVSVAAMRITAWRTATSNWKRKGNRFIGFLFDWVTSVL